jgi:hypothetical protein
MKEQDKRFWNEWLQALPKFSLLLIMKFEELIREK